MQSQTLIRKMEFWAKHKADCPAIYHRKQGAWESQTWKQYYTTVCKLAAQLIALGLNPGECVVIVAGNRPELLHAQFATIAAGGIPAPVYATSSAEQVAYIVCHSRAHFVFAENETQYKKLSLHRRDLPTEKVILMENVADRDSSWCLDFDKLIAEADSAVEVEKRIAGLQGDDTALLIYTSGTTGNPKAVMLSHDNLLITAEMCTQRYFLQSMRIVSYLPLSHIAEQMLTNLGQLTTGGEVFLCADFKKVREALLEVRPNVFLGVPRVWEKFAQAVQSEMKKLKGNKKRLVDWALRTELQCFHRQLQTGAPVRTPGRFLANKLVIKKIKRDLGLDKLQAAVTGAAPINVHIQEFFASIGIVLYEVYGMSETSAVIATTVPEKPRFGTVGQPLPQVEIRIADDGEVIARGPTMSKGYLHDKQKTDQLWQGGWLHTGDIGEFDEDGNLRITDRKKDLLITAGGKNIAPLPIEKLVQAISVVNSAVVIGDRKPYLTALITLDCEAATKAAASIGIDSSAQELNANQQFHSYLQEQIEQQVNSKLARVQTIKRFAILNNDFSIEGGELTPTMKIKRKVIVDKYSEVIETLYEN